MERARNETRGRATTARILLVLVVAAGVSGVAAAQGLADGVSVSGYGTWAYGDSDGNDYLNATETGEWGNALAALNFSAELRDRVTLFVQAHLEATDDTEIDLDYAFADWELVDNLHLRAGRVKQPFGIYTEIYDVGTLRPFLDLPQGLYNGRFVARAYSGLGLAGRTFLGNDWALEYDVYGGQIDIEWSATGVGEVTEQSTDTLGARLRVVTPVDGLRFGVSGFDGTEEQSQVEEGGVDEYHTVYGAFVEYLAHGWWVRAEYADLDYPAGNTDAAYAEVAYKLTEHWQVAGRWDWGEAKIDQAPAIYDRFYEHEDRAIAVNYWVNPGLVFKLEYHDVEGNRYAGTPTAFADFMAGTLSETTEAFQLGVNFSF